MKLSLIIGLIACMGTTNIACAAQKINDTQGKQKIGVVSAGNQLTLDSLSSVLSRKADEKGARYYKITSASGNNKMHGTAEIFR